ncbi:MAG: Oxygen-independent coproporphyrinogen-III oxidase 1 [Candidatus Izimaplasma bacterium HR2]|nr:MAG: Oxygen-independent coproporphyrinogen-III oxidase 1 [Candidatus Izimaplasma bacterium HR2]
MLTALYIHVPFCEKICVYCDFHKEIATLTKKTKYIDALIKELIKNKDTLKNIKTVYIGGGTPSNLPLDLLEKLLEAINENINITNEVEFSIETNPNDITIQKALLFSKYNINRVSVGVQTFNNDHLKFLGRTHNKSDVINAVNNLHKAGINNINIDMIFSLVKQTEAELREDIKEVLKLDITHLSYYSLILEEKTTLYHLYNQNKVSMNSEDIEALMYNIVIDSLVENGFNHYEISNFCKDGFESNHNTIYWKNLDYLGIGSGSHSLINNKRFYNESNVTKYINDTMNDIDEIKVEYDTEPLREELIMGLRLLKGININDINTKYNIDLLEDYKELNEFIKKDLLVLDNGFIHFTRKGLMLGNLVFGIF